MTSIPNGMTEEEVVDIIDKVVSRLAWKFRFGFHTVDDIKQQGWLVAWEGLETYDNIRPLENFLWTHVRNRLYNFKRDNFERPNLPCNTCPLKAYDPDYKNSDNQCTAYSDKMDCSLYLSWINRNIDKRNIMNPIELGGVADEQECNMKVWDNIEDKLDKQELFRIIEENLPIELKPDFIRLKFDIRLPKVRRDKVLSVIREILEKRGLNESEAW
jgi:hypothetical protein